MNVHLSYKPPSSLGVLFWYGGSPRQFSHIKRFRFLVVPVRGFRKRIIVQVIMTPTVVLPNGYLCLRIKGGVTGESVHAPIQRNST